MNLFIVASSLIIILCCQIFIEASSFEPQNGCFNYGCYGCQNQKKLLSGTCNGCLSCLSGNQAGGASSFSERSAIPSYISTVNQIPLYPYYISGNNYGPNGYGLCSYGSYSSIDGCKFNMISKDLLPKKPQLSNKIISKRLLQKLNKLDGYGGRYQQGMTPYYDQSSVQI
ncbi:uncharacterized protein LOC126902633 [Daktulosphaira vitifoliae]|uniref:uncharacterized protein LOC126902633 n=1 Tax=Daktulosphaira vitifoliae TaxID=58002 RepID=UPI0021A99FB8|nr:uncharacterized protein LOC126902633 [Daktulosphaira vitifoliae]XP_050536062.1 uncharacterized protein LOC126902633 [Daktulosphaira vitifoliae]XP_050536063.1 uncharacterized protein LOC126902633 [Daktulosphaira vitifoliae]